jgi:asparagine synthase (glutamine-hydrolysing)
LTLIAGVCGPGATERLAAMLRRPDWIARADARLGPAAFAAIGTTPEPMLWSDDALLVVADARIDDRADLLRRLDLLGSPISDAALIAQAWRRWGDAAPQELLGDYAFALFEKSTGRLWLVRDALGFRPLCFRSHRSTSAFCSLPSWLVTDINAATVSTPLMADRAATSRTTPLTWFADVEQVQPGEIVLLRAEGARRSFWWQPSTAPGFVGTRDDLLLETRRVLECAVAERLGQQTRVACHLSAGLDSMSIAVTAAELLSERGGSVSAITARPGPGHRLIHPLGRLVDESDYAATVAARHANMHHVVVDADHRSIANDLIEARSRFDQPLTNPSNFGWFAASCSAALGAGADRLLIAQSGNYSLSPEAGDFWWLLLRHEGMASFLAEWRRKPGWKRTLKELLRGTSLTLTRPGARKRLAALRSIDPGLFLKGFEWQGLQILDPAADRRLVELALTVPENLLIRNGDRRWVARELLRGRAPDQVLDEPRRGFQSADWLSRLRAEADVLAAMLDSATALGLARFDESATLLRTIATGFDETLDGPARSRLASDLAAAAFALACGPRFADRGATDGGLNAFRDLRAEVRAIKQSGRRYGR